MQKNAVLQFRSLFFFCCSARCKFHQLQQQRQLATILESCKFPRTIAELLSSLILFSTLLCSSTRCIFTGIWHICQKVKGFLTTSAHFLPYLFLAENSRIQMRSFVQIKTLETEEEASKLRDS